MKVRFMTYIGVLLFLSVSISGCGGSGSATPATAVTVPEDPNKEVKAEDSAASDDSDNLSDDAMGSDAEIKDVEDFLYQFEDALNSRNLERIANTMMDQEEKYPPVQN